LFILVLIELKCFSQTDAADETVDGDEEDKGDFKALELI
jgi:hypothetical protein